VLESLLNFREISKRPYLAFVWSFVILSIAVIIALRVGFHMTVGPYNVNLTGAFALIFALVASSYIMTALIRKEELLEEKAIMRHYSRQFWPRHEKDILIFLYFFGGAVLAFALWTMFLPADTFQVQLSSICAMRPELSSCSQTMTGLITGSATNAGSQFQNILVNNLEVGAFSFIFAFIFGAGSAFIILWNAGILGIYIGMISKHIFDVPLVSMKFLPHGIPEIAGYICAGLAGTLMSAAVIRVMRSARRSEPGDAGTLIPSTAAMRRANTDVLKAVAIDSLKVLLLGIGLIIFGAFVEGML
jgi:uncharacterized membrane protein SpoIIM required for sporulation